MRNLKNAFFNVIVRKRGEGSNQYLCGNSISTAIQTATVESDGLTECAEILPVQGEDE